MKKKSQTHSNSTGYLNAISWVGQSQKSKILIFSMSFLFGLVYMLTPFFASREEIMINWFRLPVGMFFFLFFLGTFTYALNWYHSQEIPSKWEYSSRAFFLISFVLIVVVDIFWLLIYYPGVGMYDSLAISKIGLGIAQQHPWFYCLLIQGITKITFFFGGGYEATLVVESLLQIFLFAGIVSYCLTWLQQKGLGKIFLFLFLCIYSFCPLLNIYTISLFKDIPYACIILAWLTILYDLWESKGKAFYQFSTCSKISVLLILSLLRNNGVYVSACILLSCLLLFSKEWKRILLLCGILLLVILSSVFFEKTHSITHLFKETVGIPLQQIAATVSSDGKITEQQKEFINQVIPLDFIKEKYNPYSADSLKWGGAPLDNHFLNQNKSTFLRVWSEMLIPNFKIYVTSYLQATYGFWSVCNRTPERYSTIYVKAFDEWIQENHIAVKAIFPEKIQTHLEKFTWAGTESFWNEGRLFWAFLFTMTLLSLWKGKHIWIIAVPCLSVWLTIMISTPIAYQWRYIFCFPITLPILWGIILLPIKK